MAQSPVIFVLSTIGEMYAFLIVMRFVLQISGADYYNPISQAIAKITNTPTLLISRAIPKIGKYDISALVYAVLFKIVLLLILILTSNTPLPGIVQIALTPILGTFSSFSISGVIETILTIYLYASFGSVIISWVAPGSYHPGPQLIQQVTEPAFAKIRKFLPSAGGLDFSPMVFIFAIWILKSLIPTVII